MPAPGQAVNNGGANAIAQNYQLRQMLLNTAPIARKKIGTLTASALGGDLRMKLFNVGITTRILLEVEVGYSITTSATISKRGIHALISRVKLTDYDGTDRVNATGFQLHTLNSFRKGRFYGADQMPAGTAGTDAVITQSALVPPYVSTSTTANVRGKYMVEVPLAYSETDLRGALLTQTAVGEAYLNISLNSALVANGSDEYVFNSANAVALGAAGVTINVYQEYIIPQAVGGQVPLPMLDLMTVYEINGALKSSDNITQNTEKLINYPNVRSVIGFYANLVNNGLLLALGTVTDTPAVTENFSTLRLLANGNNVIREYSPWGKVQDMRERLSGADYQAGVIYEDHRQSPVQTALYGNVQYGITWSVAPAGTYYVESMFESFYTKGSTLPGMTQGT